MSTGMRCDKNVPVKTFAEFVQVDHYFVVFDLAMALPTFTNNPLKWLTPAQQRCHFWLFD